MAADPTSGLPGRSLPPFVTSWMWENSQSAERKVILPCHRILAFLSNFFVYFTKLPKSASPRAWHGSLLIGRSSQLSSEVAVRRRTFPLVVFCCLWWKEGEEALLLPSWICGSTNGLGPHLWFPAPAGVRANFALYSPHFFQGLRARKPLPTAPGWFHFLAGCAFDRLFSETNFASYIDKMSVLQDVVAIDG